MSPISKKKPESDVLMTWKAGVLNNMDCEFFSNEQAVLVTAILRAVLVVGIAEGAGMGD